MGSYTQILYQLVWSTKNRIPCLAKPNRQELFKYISGILKEKKCHLYQDGFGAFTYAQNAKKNLIDYVIQQEENHKKESSRDEYIRLLDENGVAYDPKYII